MKIIKKYLLLFWNWILSFFRKEAEPIKHVSNLKKVHKDDDGYYEVHKSKMGYLISHNRIVVHITKDMEEANEWMSKN